MWFLEVRFMPRYRLKFFASKTEDDQTIAFDAEDISAALIFAHEQASDGYAELWRYDRKLCTIDRARANLELS
ncbi:hypothetical protein [Aurantiacibacter hainanensis]|uniref:hypothetical protein n=1 Tax=Aurantiacibacter hainanensis TaxID=3076114 RepID=UPI0030C6E083